MTEPTFIIGDEYQLTETSLTLFRNGMALPLNAAPSKVLKFLAELRRSSSEYIKAEALSEHFGISTATIRGYIHDIRNVMFQDAIRTVTNDGYMLALPVVFKPAPKTDIKEEPVDIRQETSNAHSRTELSPAMRLDHFNMLLEYCGPDSVTKEVMRISDTTTRFAVDKCFQLVESEEYQGWREADISMDLAWEAAPLAEDLMNIINDHPPREKNGKAADNNGKWILEGLSPDSTEVGDLAVVLRKSDYYHTKPIQERMHSPVLLTGSGIPCAPMQKYGHDLTHHASSPIPSLVCLNVIVELGDGRLLLTQRKSRKEDSRGDWEFGKWSTSFEEQMGSGKALFHPYPGHEKREPPSDTTFFHTIYRGAEEELGTTDLRSPHILSIVMEAYAACTNVLAIVKVDTSLDEIRALWETKAKDGKKELKRVAAMDYDFETILPVLAGNPLVIPWSASSEGRIAISTEEWNLTGRMRLLVALFKKHGADETRAQFYRYVRSL